MWSLLFAKHCNLELDDFRLYIIEKRVAVYNTVGKD